VLAAWDYQSTFRPQFRPIIPPKLPPRWLVLVRDTKRGVVWCSLLEGEAWRVRLWWQVNSPRSTSNIGHLSTPLRNPATTWHPRGHGMSVIRGVWRGGFLVERRHSCTYGVWADWGRRAAYRDWNSALRLRLSWRRRL